MVEEMKRLSAYLADPVYDHLEKWAESENRSLSSLVGYLLERSVRDHRRELGLPSNDLLKNKNTESNR